MIHRCLCHQQCLGAARSRRCECCTYTARPLCPLCHLKTSPITLDLLLLSNDQRLDKVVLRLQALLAVVVVFPFSVWRLWLGQYPLAALGLIAVTFLAGLGLLSLSARLFEQVGRVVLPWVIAIQMAVICAMVAYGGTETKSWLFPAIVSAFLLLRTREATVIALLSSATAAWLAFQGSGALRDSMIFFAACLLVILFTHVFASRLNADRQMFKTRSLQDALTGVGNRRLLDDTLAALVLQPGQASCGLILLDVDHFKAINDRFGHHVGDACLTRFAQAVASQLTSSDSLYRFGGEEFVVLSSRSAEDVFSLAERIRQHIEHSQILREARLTVSAGVAPLVPGRSVRDWLASADGAMYQAKESGRNRVVLAGEA